MTEYFPAAAELRQIDMPRQDADDVRAGLKAVVDVVVLHIAELRQRWRRAVADVPAVDVHMVFRTGVDPEAGVVDTEIQVEAFPEENVALDPVDLRGTPNPRPFHLLRQLEFLRVHDDTPSVNACDSVAPSLHPSLGIL